MVYRFAGWSHHVPAGPAYGPDINPLPYLRQHGITP